MVKFTSKLQRVGRTNSQTLTAKQHIHAKKWQTAITCM